MARVRDLWKNPDRRGGRGKRWLAVWTGPDGAEHTQAFAKKTDADRYGQAQETDAARGTYIDPKAARITVAQWCETWLAGYATRRPSTVRQARVHVAQIKNEFGQLPLGAVRPSHVKAWTSRLRGEGAAVSYVYALHARLAQIMGDAVHDGLLGRSPCSRRTSPGAGRQRAYVATTEQVWALHDAMPEHLRAAILLGAFAGLRCAEACGLRVADVDFMRGVISPAVQFPAEELKTEISRTAIPVPRSLALEDLRHYLASLLIASGADVKTVQARLRHASAKTTLDTYGHLWPDRDESTRAAIDAVLSARAEQGRNAESAR
jgi:integrase